MGAPVDLGAMDGDRARGAGTWVVLPTYDEAENVGPITAAILESLPDAHILVVEPGAHREHPHQGSDREDRALLVVLPYRLGWRDVERPGCQRCGRAGRPVHVPRRWP